MGINFGEIDIEDKNYPKNLKEALKNLIESQGPKKLYYKGDFSVLDHSLKNNNCLAVVGSRHLTSYGRKVAEQIVGQLATAGIVIVSGFMYGGDEAAHSACVNVGGKTIAVMPCGIDRIHPSSQAELYNKILQNKGLIISEYEADLQPQNWMYVQRDRIVAGLCKAVLVLEATENSGSLITASYAKKFGRKVFAIPGQITSELARGTNKLIREGAELVTEANDILKFYKLLVNPSKVAGRGQIPNNLQGSDPCATSLEAKIIQQLQREPMKADQLARLFSVPVSQLGTTLSMMQLKSLINNDGDKYFIN